MQSLKNTLAAYDLEMLRVVANRWDVDLGSRDAQKAAEQLATAMLQPEKVADVWSRLPDEHRGALQALLGGGGKMPTPMFSRLYGTPRTFGPDKLAREKPYLEPQNIAEYLYYRGLIAMTIGGSSSTPGEVGKTAKALAFVYIPTDLAALMPSHVTGYKVEATQENLSAAPQPTNIKQADTSIIDDLTTLLAACYVEEVPYTDASIPAEYRSGLKPYFVGGTSPARVGLMCALALDLNFAAPSGDPQTVFKTIPSNARNWLEAPRPTQVRRLAEAWRGSAHYDELRHLTGIKVEKADNDPLLPRQTVLTFLEMVPPADWWPIDELISAVKDNEPDFMRLEGDYDSWYIRDGQSGEYLRGFEKSWDRVEGALLRFILIGPMHGLGLLDIANDASACRLTPYGRAFLEITEWPESVGSGKEGAPIKIGVDGTCEVPRSTSRFERFQLARFADWLASADPYKYQISANSIERARGQNISADQLISFLRRVSSGELSESLVKQIEVWGQSHAHDPATLSRVVILRVPKSELLEAIQNNPALRRYLGQQLGPQVVIVREGQWEALKKAMQDNGIPVQSDLKE